MRRSSVNSVIFSKDKKKILLVKRRDVPLWVIPGGAIDEGENPEEAVVREIFEETGCKVSILRKVGIYHPVNNLTGTVHLFACEVTDGTPQTGNETREIGFFDLNCPPAPFFYVHGDFIKDSLKSDAPTFEKKLSQITYLNLFKYFLKHPIQVSRFLLSQIGFPINS